MLNLFLWKRIRYSGYRQEVTNLKLQCYWLSEWIIENMKNKQNSFFEPPFEVEIHEKLMDLQSQPPFDSEKIEAGAAEELKNLFRMSEFAYRVCLQHPDFVGELTTGDSLITDYTYATYYGELNKLCAESFGEADLSVVFRQFRNQQMLRLAWRDMVRKIDVQMILKELSYLADACINVALEKITALSKSEFGEPVDTEGKPIELVVFAMGKLGAFELNYSSDIDLIFCYSEEGEINGDKKLSHSEFFLRLCRRFVRLLNDNTAYGFVYRVDTRLRPFGDSGQLAFSFNAMERYYERHGREWERYALIKARAISLDVKAASEIAQRLQPFVYRRYLDFGVFESLREMKEMIEAELVRKGTLNNVKLGEGGIREIEFIGQVFQLIRGGRTKELQIRPILDVLSVLHSQNIIPDYVYGELVSSYIFLRKAENAIQAYDDKQTHILPVDALQQARLAYALNFSDWDEFEKKLSLTMQTVHEIFEQIFSAPQLQSFGSKGDKNTHLIERLWLKMDSNDLEASQEDDDEELLTKLGYKDSHKALQLINGLKKNVRYKSASPQSQRRIDRLMPLIISSVAHTDFPDVGLLRLISLVESIITRSAYISLLSEHPVGLSQLVKLVGKSEWISDVLIRSPILLDELLDPRRLYEMINKNDLEKELQIQLRSNLSDDIEQQMRCLSEFKQSNVFRVAASELNGVMPVNKISDHLTYIAEIVVAAAHELSLQHVSLRYGQPKYTLTGEADKYVANFCVVAYGKMGSLELGFSSDLDLVFLHDSQGVEQETVVDSADSAGSVKTKSVDNGLFFARVAQRIMHFLNTRTENGMLYEVDTRLRPSGGAGILVSNLQSFAVYQRKKAWTWEHQSLIRARAVTGTKEIVAAFEQIRREILTLPRNQGALKKDVVDMREKMRQELYKKRTNLFNVKQSVGGITDIEFIIQYLALAWASKYPQIIEYTDNLRIIESLVKNAILSDEDAKILTTAYLAYREKAHINTLQGRSLDIELSGGFKTHQQGVEKIWQKLMKQN